SGLDVERSIAALDRKRPRQEFLGWVQRIVLRIILRARRRVDLIRIEKEDIACAGGFTPSGRSDLSCPPFDRYYRVRAVKMRIKTTCRGVNTQEVRLLRGKAHGFNLRHRKRPVRANLHKKHSR